MFQKWINIIWNRTHLRIKQVNKNLVKSVGTMQRSTYFILKTFLNHASKIIISTSHFEHKVTFDWNNPHIGFKMAVWSRDRTDYHTISTGYWLTTFYFYSAWFFFHYRAPCFCLFVVPFLKLKLGRCCVPVFFLFYKCEEVLICWLV